MKNYRTGFIFLVPGKSSLFQETWNTFGQMKIWLGRQSIGSWFDIAQDTHSVGATTTDAAAVVHLGIVDFGLIIVHRIARGTVRLDTGFQSLFDTSNSLHFWFTLTFDSKKKEKMEIKRHKKFDVLNKDSFWVCVISKFKYSNSIFILRAEVSYFVDFTNIRAWGEKVLQIKGEFSKLFFKNAIEQTLM